jgi:hypothetical protein
MLLLTHLTRQFLISASASNLQFSTRVSELLMMQAMPLESAKESRFMRGCEIASASKFKFLKNKPTMNTIKHIDTDVTLQERF